MREIKKWLTRTHGEMSLVPYPMPHPYIICLEVPQVSDDANPDKERRRSKQNAAQIVICEILRNEKIDVSKTFHSTQLIDLTLNCKEGTCKRMDCLPFSR